ncbi:hypothetical protein VNO80_11193 [Phaseolus coccineus]|uniref:Uncharacterized protein n=1 Tax=Phaseolus coccineus TaxID=3886 RepID=A0AAN9NEW6_PHACN
MHHLSLTTEGDFFFTAMSIFPTKPCTKQSFIIPLLASKIKGQPFSHYLSPQPLQSCILLSKAKSSHTLSFTLALQP